MYFIFVFPFSCPILLLHSRPVSFLFVVRISFLSLAAVPSRIISILNLIIKIDAPHFFKTLIKKVKSVPWWFFFQLVSGWEWTQMFPFFSLSPSPPPDSQIEKELHPKMEIVCVQIPFLKSSFKRFLVCVQPKKNSSWLGCCCIYFIELQTYFFIFMGEKFCPFGVPSSGNICGDFFFFCTFKREEKCPWKEKEKKANDLRKTLF
jgi:hypothetical protein